jgi:hypothetical protein
VVRRVRFCEQNVVLEGVLLGFTPSSEHTVAGSDPCLTCDPIACVRVSVFLPFSCCLDPVNDCMRTPLQVD